MSYHPLLDCFAVVGLTALVIGFTRATSRLRIGVLPILISLTWHCLLECPNQIPRSSWASAVGGYTLSSTLHYIDVALLGGWSFHLQGPARDLIRGLKVTRTPKPTLRTGQKKAGIAPRLRYGLAVVFSWRFVNTPYQVKRLPQLDESLRRSRRRFLLHAATTVVVCYAVLDIMESSSDDEVAKKFYSSDKVGLFSRLGQITVEEMIMRFFAALGLCAGMISFQRGVYNFVALVCVGAGLSAPEDWPPFNGPILQTHSLRYFWSFFWHQINTHRFTAISNYVMHDVLRLRTDGSSMRYVRTWLIFLLCAVFHVAIDLSAGISVRESGAMQFFLIQPLGVVIEDFVLSPLNLIAGTKSTQSPTLVQRCLGLAWVCLWMAWTAPVYLYPIMDRSGSTSDGIVPFSVVAFVKGMVG